MAEELERKAHNFLTDVKSKKKPALQVRGKIAVTVNFFGNFPNGSGGMICLPGLHIS